VLDSNVLVVAVEKKSLYRSAFLQDRYQLVLSGEILFKYKEIL
jgi:hypothetical protein